MARIQDIDLPYLEFGEAAAPGTPAAAVSRLYVKADGLFYSKDDAGTETLVSGGLAGSGAFVGCTAVSSATTAMTTTTTEYPIALAGVDEIDTDAFHDPATNNTRLTIPAGKGGKYSIRAGSFVATSATKYVDLKIRKNGAAGLVLGQNRVSTSDGNQIIQVHTKIVALAAADYVELYAMANEATRVADLSWVSVQYLGT